MYVALTRAEEQLYLTHATKRYLYRESQYQMISRFCKELGLYQEKPKESFKPYPSNIASQPSFSQFEKARLFNHNMISKEEKKPLKDVSVYKLGQIVSHPRFGEGEIVEISEDGLVGDIIFEDFGKKSLMLDLAPLEIVKE